MSVRDEIQRLKREKNAVILAHYYVEDAIQDIADEIGDSFYLSKKAAQTDAVSSYSVAYPLWGRARKSSTLEKKC